MKTENKLPRMMTTLGDGTQTIVEIVTNEHQSPGFYVCRRVDNNQVLRVHRDCLKSLEETK